MNNYIKNLSIVLMTIFITIVSGITYSTLNAATPPYPVTVTNIRFLGGIGKGPTSSGEYYLAGTYLRGYGQSGTIIEVTAEMDNGGPGAPMYGDVLVTITFTNGGSGTFNVTIPSGSQKGTAVIPYNNTFPGCAAFNVVAGSTQPWVYTATAVSGDYVSVLTSSTSQTINWDNQDAPSSGTPAIIVQQATTTTTSLSIYWSPVSTIADQDFYEYRIYYRESSTSTTGPYKLWNGNNDSSLRGLANNPFPPIFPDPIKRFDLNGWKYTTIPNLKLFSNYDYFITAVDVFGNEITELNAGPAAGPLRTVATKPLTLAATISDGITTFNDFTTLAIPTDRTLQESNIKVDIYTVTSTETPDACIIWFSTVASDLTDMITILNAPNVIGLPADLDSVAAVKTGPNKWTAYLHTIPPSGITQMISNGTAVRFIVELQNRGVSTFIDTDSGTDPNNAEWTFYIGNTINFKPWPTKILNNVITKKNPAAYPSYYLTEDAYVTIKIYDIKGRVVSTLLENSFRRGGQNIKENGWYGSNKYKNKVGIGLYYININAKSASNGKTLLMDFKKVVMAH